MERNLAGHRRPSVGWNRLKNVQVDPLDEIGLPSKGEKRHASVHPSRGDSMLINCQTSRSQDTRGLLWQNYCPLHAILCRCWSK